MKRTPCATDPRCSTEQTDQQKSNFPAEVVRDVVHVDGSKCDMACETVSVDQLGAEELAQRAAMLARTLPAPGGPALDRQVGAEHVDVPIGEEGRQRFGTNGETQAPLSRLEDARLPQRLHDEAVFPDFPVVDRHHLEGAAPMPKPGRFNVPLATQTSAEADVHRVG